MVAQEAELRLATPASPNEAQTAPWSQFSL